MTWDALLALPHCTVEEAAHSLIAPFLSPRLCFNFLWRPVVQSPPFRNLRGCFSQTFNAEEKTDPWNVETFSDLCSQLEMEPDSRCLGPQIRWQRDTEQVRNFMLRLLFSHSYGGSLKDGSTCFPPLSPSHTDGACMWLWVFKRKGRSLGSGHWDTP